MKCIYASEIAALVGANRFKTPEEAWETIEKRIKGEVKEYNEVEELARAEYSRVCGERLAARNKLTKSHVSDLLECYISEDSTASREEVLEAIAVGAEISASREVIQDIISEFPEKVTEDSEEAGRVLTHAEISKILCANQVARQEAAGIPHLTKEYGCYMESQQLTDRNQQITLKKKLNDKWLIYGRADALENGTVIEIKNRMNKIYDCMFTNDKIQLMTYMWMADLERGILEQHCKGQVKKTTLEYDAEWYEGILDELIEFLDSH